MFLFEVLCAVAVILIALYFIMIMPRMFCKPSREPHVKVLYAHRGLHDNNSEAPENSMAAFKKAVDAGYGIECDVQLSKDGVPVIFHDFTLERVARNEDGTPAKGKVIDYTYEELLQFRLLNSNERIPKFEDFLKLVDGKIPLIIELKIELKDLSVCPKVDNLLRDYKGVYCIESFNPLGLIWYKRHNPGIMRGQLSDEFHKEKPEEFNTFLYFSLTYLFLNVLAKPDFIAYNHKYPYNLSLWLCRHLYKNVTAAWTIKSEEELDRAKRNFDIYIFDSFIPADGPNL
ncbi:glycerophosphodiester phosphodiesterase family protein [Butyrivibrio sp. INlla21]|uniref:glycerophosphodiester phosphodiesterase family protein n=1 Tax=Butyrivibrio sp. INlla21 TaxID=1520811 RepID=UPI0008EA1B3E|nr:glycerophosphodiester phosphodiesterase family protein [Butyrivibrio sp. INlla21]SFU42445.1 Glycerophosphoryl diester phosphodiesterase [Butyrivibrio sp. INlla21]